jgi:tetratricopeptide (TPR) repeat protein
MIGLRDRPLLHILLVALVCLSCPIAQAMQENTDARRDLQINSQRLLSRGRYQEAIAAAEQLIGHPTQDPILLIWGLRVKVLALGLLNRTDEAVQAVHQIIQDHHGDDRIYSGSDKYPMSMTVRLTGYSYIVALSRITEDFPRATQACEALQATWRECLSWAHEEENTPQLYQPFVQCEVMLGDFRRLSGDFKAAADHYRKAVRFVREHPWPRDKVLGAGWTDEETLNRVTPLLEQCERWSPNQQGFVSNVDYKIEMARIHEEAGEQFSSVPQWQRARERYKQAEAYLQSHEPPSGIVNPTRYKELREVTLPDALKRCARGIARLPRISATPAPGGRAAEAAKGTTAAEDCSGGSGAGAPPAGEGAPEG